MRIGTSLLLIAAGAILKYAVEDHVKGVNLATIGVILMIVGAAGLVLSLFLLSTADRGETHYIRRRRRVVEDDLPPRY